MLLGSSLNEAFIPNHTILEHFEISDVLPDVELSQMGTTKRTNKPVTTEPVTTEPVTTEPVTTEPVTTEQVKTSKLNIDLLENNLYKNIESLEQNVKNSVDLQFIKMNKTIESLLSKIEKLEFNINNKTDSSGIKISNKKNIYDVLVLLIILILIVIFVLVILDEIYKFLKLK